MQSLPSDLKQIIAKAFHDDILVSAMYLRLLCREWRDCLQRFFRESSKPERMVALKEFWTNTLCNDHVSIFRWARKHRFSFVCNEKDFEIAILSGRAPVISTILSDEVDVKHLYTHDATPLLLAAAHGPAEIVRRLLARGADPNVYNSFYSTPLWKAALRGEVECVRSLLAYGADVDDRDSAPTPLLAASREGHVAVVQLLIQAGAKINSTGRNSATALHLAAENGHVEVVDALIRAGADVNAVDDRGRTPLARAVIGMHAKVVLRLMQAEADIHKPDWLNHSVIDLARRTNHPDILKLLVPAT